MPPIVILTDSSADIDPALRQSLGIASVPLKVVFGQETYLDGVTLTAGQFFEKLKNSEELPTTSQPSPLDFVEGYKQIVERHGKEVQIIVLTVAASLSGTYQSALIAKSMMEEEIDITVIDSKAASFLQGFAAVEAARAVQAGKNKQQVLDLLDRILGEIRVYFIVDTLTYLQKGGRIGKASALIGSLLQIKPILSLDPLGTVYAFDKVRGTKKALARVFEALREYAQNEPVKALVLHGAAEGEANALLEQVKQQFRVEEAFLAEVGPVIGTHTGPGVLAVAMVKV
ncbi:DegV family protein [Brevibacillus fulvus]|uniref:DegV family protein with EDD domain n=1 Tax=Brevibacillus fulvus TaxID=1125967 RepID=A0A938XXC0_9BACL|nr:DegV family protein [Brevibacillus fulvus]MBM7589415.1 DegV family protein with EDD domain [Brevibacillus fulvus]